MWGRQCRELLDKTVAWAQVKGNWKCRRTGWGPAALKEMKEVSGQLAPVGGGKGPVPFAPLSGNIPKQWRRVRGRIVEHTLDP